MKRRESFFSEAAVIDTEDDNMSDFRYAVMGAGDISKKFCDAVRRIENCTVCAVSSKSEERAKAFSESQGIPNYYGNYEEMLIKEHPDCVYIGADTGSHYRLTMLCLSHKIPVLCEKAMFTNVPEMEKCFEYAKEQNTFVMEAMWSYYLPAIRKAKEWVDEKRIGTIRFTDILLGFKASTRPGNRYFNKELGGGTAFDLSVYTYDITTLMLGHDYKECKAAALWHESGVDTVNHATLIYENTLASLTSSIVNPLEERLIMYGEEGKIIVPHSHYANEAYLYGADGSLLEHFTDRETVNGFVYEVKDAMECVKACKTESDTVPWCVTRASTYFYRELGY